MLLHTRKEEQPLPFLQWDPENVFSVTAVHLYVHMQQSSIHSYDDEEVKQLQQHKLADMTSQRLAL